VWLIFRNNQAIPLFITSWEYDTHCTCSDVPGIQYLMYLAEETPSMVMYLPGVMSPALNQCAFPPAETKDRRFSRFVVLQSQPTATILADNKTYLLRRISAPISCWQKRYTCVYEWMDGEWVPILQHVPDGYFLSRNISDTQCYGTASWSVHMWLAIRWHFMSQLPPTEILTVI
jgi:hypothetical protein